MQRKLNGLQQTSFVSCLSEVMSEPCHFDGAKLIRNSWIISIDSNFQVFDREGESISIQFDSKSVTYFVLCVIKKR